VVGPDPGDKCADRPSEERRAEDGEDEDQRAGLRHQRQHDDCEHRGERSEQREVVPLHHVGDAGHGQGSTTTRVGHRPKVVG
jgi:hypothetical protein